MQLTRGIIMRAFALSSSDESVGEDAVQQKGEEFPLGGAALEG